MLIRSLESGGAERQLVELARGLHERGHAVTVATFYKRGPLTADVEQAGIDLIDLRKRGRWEVLGFLNRARKALSRSNPDVLYSFLGGANIIATTMRSAGRRTRLVWSIRSSDVDLSRYDWLHRISYRIERLLSRTPALIIANSYSARDHAAANGFPLRRIEVVPNGIDIDRFKPDAVLRHKQRLRWELANDQIAVGVLARLDPMKGHAVFLRAAAEVAQARRDVHFFCIGAGPEEAQLKELALELGVQEKVHFTGAASNPVSALNGLDVCCSPSLFGEGFSNSIAEAMACGVPCVVTDVGDSAKIVGDVGTVVPRSHPDALAKAILKTIGDLSQIKKKNARERIVSNFSVATMIDNTTMLLNRLF